MIGRPETSEAAPYYFNYINQVDGDNPIRLIEGQLDQALSILSAIPEQKSLHRYAPDKWSIRQVVSHLNDTERVFAFRAMWFARGFSDPLPSFDQNIASDAAGAVGRHGLGPAAEARLSAASPGGRHCRGCPQFSLRGTLQTLRLRQ